MWGLPAGTSVGNSPKPTNDVFDQFNHALKHYDEVLRSHGSSDIYIGGTYGANGFNPKFQSEFGDVIMGGNTAVGGNTGNKPSGYTANAAKTANSIAQGGMTKNEVQEFNIKHPNETAKRSE